MNLAPILVLLAAIVAGAWWVCSPRRAAAVPAKAAAAPAPRAAAPRQVTPRQAAPAPVGFDPNKSHVDDDVRRAFIEDENSNEDVTAVPSVGAETARIFARGSINIHTVANLIGKFLILRRPGMTPQQHCNAFSAWLSSVGVGGRNRHTIVLVIADKVGSLMPMLRYDTSTIVDDEDS